MATLIDRCPEPTGVVVGPLSAIPRSRIESSVRSGSGLPSSSKTSTPAGCSSHSNSTSVASSTRRVASAISGPVPSPGMRVTRCAMGREFYYPRAAGELCHHSLGMLSGRSIQLVRVFGIRIGVDPSWFFVLFLIIWSLSGYYKDLFPGEDTKAFTLAVVSALLFFLSILLHELGHAVVAIRNGIGISGIDLWMFGGVARMERDTDSPGVEFRVAAAGPVVTLLIALVCFGLGSALASPHDVLRGSRFET